MNIPNFDDVCRAHERIKPYIHETPVVSSTFLNELTGAQLFFKCENFQKTGAFKARGASNAIFSLSKQQATHGVITHSSGNHASALSYAANCRGIPCYVVMPRNAPQVKKDAVMAYGGHITVCESSIASREMMTQVLQYKTGAEFIHPYNDARVIAGQATCAKELMRQVEGLDSVIAPIGGGGMVSGMSLTLSHMAPQVAIYAAEPEQADDAARSFKAGYIIADDAPVTIADGLKVPLRDLTWHFVSTHVNDIVTVSEQDIIAAMRLIWTRMKIVIEASCAVPLAAIIKNKDIFLGKKVGVMLTGGNVDVDTLPWNE